MSSLVDPERFTELVNQKELLHAKIISDSGVYSNLVQTINTRELFSDLAYSTVFDMNIASMLSAFLFDIPPIDLSPLDYLRQVALASVDEMRQGISVTSKLTDLSSLIEQLLEQIRLGNIQLPQGVSTEDFINSLINYERGVEEITHSNIDTNEAIDINNTVPKKAYYEETKYDESYYDPPNVLDFLRSTFYKMFQLRGDIKLLAKDILTIADQFNIDRNATIGLFNRLSLIRAIRYNQFVLGYSLLGASLINETNEVSFIDIDGNIITVPIEKFEDAFIGFILGLSPLGYGYLSKEESFLKELLIKKVVVASPSREIINESTLFIFDIIERKIDDLVKNYFYTPHFFSNYSRPEERSNFLKSETADIWHDQQGFRYFIESRVDAILSDIEPSPFIRRLYKSAILNLLSYWKTKRGWGHEFINTMSYDEYKSFWLEHWKGQGLNTDILLRIVGDIESCIMEPKTSLVGVQRKWMRKLQSMLEKYRPH